MLSTERRQAVRSLLEAAFKLDPADRDDFIRHASGANAALRDETLAVLEKLREMRIAGSAVLTDSDLLDELLRDTGDEPTQVGEGGGASAAFTGTGRFEIRRTLGSGGFGTVYETYDRDLQQLVALKVLRQTDPAFLYRFKREFRALVDIRHPNLVQLYELFCEDQSWFFTMEFVRGLSFLQYVERDATETGRDSVGHDWSTKEFVYPPPRTPCHLPRLREALRNLSEGIVALHARGIVHRDIKPANVLVPSDGRVRLLDFGLVHELEGSGPRSQIMLAGTPGYMAPERLALQPAGTPSDWYSVGVMTFQALTGALPSNDHRSGHDWPASILSRIADVPPDLEQLCIDLMQPDPARRPTGADVLARLDSPAPAGPRAVADAAAPELVVGRERELARLTALLEVAKQGRTVVVNLSGQSGIGKSTVLRTFRRQLARADPDVVMLIGRCHENESVPFKALDDLVDRLSHYLKALRSTEAEVLAPRDAPSLIRMFPVLAQVDAIARGRRSDVVDAEELRHRAFGSLQDLLARLAERKTLVLAIDDLQWGDLDSAAFLRALLGGTSPPSLLLIAAYRAEDATTSPFVTSWLTYLSGARALVVEPIELGELTMAESQRLAAGLLKSHAGISEGEAAESIVRESRGSPFLIEHFVRSIRWDRADRAGFSIRHAVEDRFRELPDRTRGLLETLAIAGQPLSEAVACAAAEWDAGDRPTLLTLVTEHFVRVRETDAARQLEIYHDRLREAIVASMPPSTRQQRHRSLATVLERETHTDPEAISTHWREAGHPDRASSYAAAAGDRASNALAFERAAQWYRLALETGSWNRSQMLELQRKLGDALALAGRGMPAADVYLAAAEALGPQERVGLLRLAAEQLLRTGHIDEGLAVLERLAQGLGIWLAPSHWQQLLSVVLHRFRGALPSVGGAARPDQMERQLMILDVYWSFLIGLVDLDAIRALDFHTRHKTLAARVGDPKHVALSLAMEAANQAAFTGRDSPRIRNLIARARATCAQIDAPEALGFINTSEAMCVWMTGDWDRASRLAEDAERFLSEHCSGVAWEHATSIGLRVDTAFHRGEWAKLADYAQHFRGRLEEARARGDLHAIVVSMLEGTMGFIIADQPALAEQFLLETRSALPQNRFLIPNVWAVGIQIFIALYVGDAERAWRLVDGSWRDVEKSKFLRVQWAAIAAIEPRARAAVAVAAAKGGAPEYLRDAAACAAKLARKNPRWATALSLLIRAGVANVRQKRQETLEFLQRAETEFQTCGMAQYVAVCKYRRGMLIGGEEGRALIAAAEGWAESQRVVNPARVFDMLTPGDWKSKSATP